MSTVPIMPTFETHLANLAQEDQAQPGDPAKLVEMVLDLARQDGVAADREITYRVPLDVDCCEEVKAKCETTLQLLNAWKPTIRSTEIQE
jgi:hypothetical protein